MLHKYRNVSGGNYFEPQSTNITSLSPPISEEESIARNQIQSLEFGPNAHPLPVQVFLFSNRPILMQNVNVPLGRGHENFFLYEAKQSKKLNEWSAPG